MNDIISKIRSNKILVYLLTGLITYQIYFPVFKGKSLTLFFVLSVVLFLAQPKIDFKNIRSQSIYFYGLFMIFIFLSFFYSADKVDAFKYIFFLSFAIPIFYAYRNGPLEKEKCMKAFVYSAAPLAVFVIVLFIFERYELKVLCFGFMKLFIEPNSLLKCITTPYSFTTLEPHKVGGFFLNAQVGSLFAGFNIFASLYLFLNEKKKKFAFLALLWTASLVAFGGRIAFVALVVSLVLSILFWITKNNIVPTIKSTIMVLLIAAFAFGILIISNPRIIRLEGQLKTLDGRTLIWDASLKVIKENWLLGVGLDAKSWDAKYNTFASKNGAQLSVPPHNMFLLIWGKSGLCALLLIFIFLFVTLFRSLNTYVVSGDLFQLLIFSILIWVIVFALTENFVIMDPRVLGALWMLLGLNERNEEHSVSR